MNLDIKKYKHLCVDCKHYHKMVVVDGWIENKCRACETKNISFYVDGYERVTGNCFNFNKNGNCTKWEPLSREGIE